MNFCSLRQVGLSLLIMQWDQAELFLRPQDPTLSALCLFSVWCGQQSGTWSRHWMPGCH